MFFLSYSGGGQACVCVCAILSSPRCLAQGPSILFFVAGGQAQARACVCVCVSYYFILRAPHIGALRLPLSSLCRRQSLCVQMCLCVCPTTSSTSHRSTALSLIFVSHKRPSSCLYKCLCVYVYVPYHFKHLTQEHCPFPIICFTQEAKLVFVYVFVFVCACVCMCMCPTTSSTSHRSTALFLLSVSHKRPSLCVYVFVCVCVCALLLQAPHTGALRFTII